MAQYGRFWNFEVLPGTKGAWGLNSFVKMNKGLQLRGGGGLSFPSNESKLV